MPKKREKQEDGNFSKECWFPKNRKMHAFYDTIENQPCHSVQWQCCASRVFVPLAAHSNKNAAAFYSKQVAKNRQEKNHGDSYRLDRQLLAAPMILYKSAENAIPLQIRAMKIARNTRQRYNQNEAESLCGRIIKNLASVSRLPVFHDLQREKSHKCVVRDPVQFFSRLRETRDSRPAPEQLH